MIITAPVFVECTYCEGQGEVVTDRPTGRCAVEAEVTRTCGFCKGLGGREVECKPVTGTGHLTFDEVLAAKGLNPDFTARSDFGRIA